MYERLLERRAREALSDTPVVLIVGPRRAGKTTLVRKIGGADRAYVTLDDRTTLDAAQSDPIGFVRGLNEATIVDDGMVAGIEVKSAATVRSGDFAGLRTLAEACGGRFSHGVVLHDSTDPVPFGDRMAAVPLSCLWA